jgi:hypothetical protein
MVKTPGIVLTGMLLVGVSGAIPAVQGEAGTQKKNLKKEPIASSTTFPRLMGRQTKSLLLTGDYTH